MIQVAQLNFREMEHQICLLGINQTISGSLYAGGMDAPEDGGVLAYGYVDTEGGFTFEILAPAKVEGDKIIPLPGVPDMMVKLHKEQANECSIRLGPVVDRTPYERKIAVINEAYAPSEDVAAIRSVDLIDDSRHPDYPDDILVIFLKDDYKPEGCWVRSMEVEEGRCIGKLLNEPDQDYGVHENDLIPFDIVKEGEDYFCISRF